MTSLTLERRSIVIGARSLGKCEVRGVLEAARFGRSFLLPPCARCEVCGESDPLKLEADASRILCADHRAVAAGRPAFEQHHIGGRGWFIVADVTPNLHRVLSTLQRVHKDEPGSTEELLDDLADIIHAVADDVRQQKKVKASKPSKRRRTS